MKQYPDMLMDEMPYTMSEMECMPGMVGDVGCMAPPMPKIRLAQAFIPVQPYVGMVPLEEGFKRGSIFPNLYDPYKSRQKENQ